MDPIDRVEDPSFDHEKKDDTQDMLPAYEDPFGDETFAEVKYRTLRWWYVFDLQYTHGLYPY
jgi:hypothetical protein